MKILGALIVTALILIIFSFIAVFGFSPGVTIATPQAQATAMPLATEPALIVNLQPTTDFSQREAIARERETVYQLQISQYQQILQDRQATYQNQLQALSTQVAVTQNQLNELQTQEQAWQAQTVELENTRNQRINLYQNQLQEAQAQYLVRFAEIQTLIDTLTLQIAQIKAQSGS